MKALFLVNPTKELNGILVKKTSNNINSCELRKVSVRGRDNGYIASVNLSGAIVQTGGSWRGKTAKSPINSIELKTLVKSNLEEIINIIKQ